MSLLLDTHVFIWWMTSPDRLPKLVHERIAGNSEVALLSAVTAYEMEYKAARGSGMPNLGPDVTSLARLAGFDWLAVEPEDAVTAGRLPIAHRDPWDRMLIAQAKTRSLELITADAAIHAVSKPCGVTVFW